MAFSTALPEPCALLPHERDISAAEHLATVVDVASDAADQMVSVLPLARAAGCSDAIAMEVLEAAHALRVLAARLKVVS